MYLILVAFYSRMIQKISKLDLLVRQFSRKVFQKEVVCYSKNEGLKTDFVPSFFVLGRVLGHFSIVLL